VNDPSRIGFISTRLAGTDGVSLETTKWVKVLNRLGHESFYFAGESDWPEERSYVVPEAHFSHPEILQLTTDLFDDYRRDPESSRKIEKLKNHLKQHLHNFLRKFEPAIIIVENGLSLPMNVPLGLALTELIAETGIPTIAHHHDFTWERQRFSISAAEDYLRAAFPPTLHHVRHVVINSFAESQLALRTGLSSVLIPNVMDFDDPPPEPDGYADDLCPELGIGREVCFLLQPTRIVPRKRIEMAIELARRMKTESVLVITHHSGDEGSKYEEYLRNYAHLMGVRVLFAADRFAPERGQTETGSKVYSLVDCYHKADLVTYPSRVEGFGNAFLETIYYRRPIVMSDYEIFKTDIRPKGFKIIDFTDFITDDCVKRAEEVLRNPEVAEEMVAHNYEIGCRHYSFRMLETRLKALLNESLGYDQF
jgi:glycosyltransferase involved in cell wall biosynthesis